MMPRSPDAANEPAERRDDFVPFTERMRAVRELVTTLQVVTHAGQHHVMDRALDILRRDISRVAIPLTDLRSISLTCALRELEEEARQISARSSVFEERARFIVTILFEIWTERQVAPIATGA